MEISMLVAGIVIGGLIGLLIARVTQKPIVNIEKERLLEKNIDQLKEEMENLRNQFVEAKNKVATKEAQTEALEERIQELKQLKDIFKSAADGVLREAGKDITDAGGKKFNDILEPLRASIDQFRQKIETEGKERASLKGEVEQLYKLNQQMSKEANNLTNALKGHVTTRGKWGEFILDTILQKSGLEEGREYTKQGTQKGEDGSRPRPDVIFNLPGDKHIVLDSKVTLKDYEDFCSSEHEETHEKFLKNYISAVRERIKTLSSKEYCKIEGISSPDFVIMFLPIEGAFSTAMHFDSDLVMDAYDKNVLILSPSLLIATLRIIYNIWQLEKQNRNVVEIAKQAGGLYDKFVGFLEDLKIIGNRIKSSQDSYDSAMKKLKDGSGNLISRTEKIKILGAKTTKEMPKEFQDSIVLTDEDRNDPF